MRIPELNAEFAKAFDCDTLEELREYLEKRILRHIGPAFVEDPLRVLRGMHFVARLNLCPDEKTIALCKTIVMEGIPPERIFEEWKKLLPKKDRPDLAAEQDFFMTLDPALKMVPRERLIQAFEKAEISRSLRTTSVEWNEHGPDNVGGRTRAVMFDPNDPANKPPPERNSLFVIKFFP